MGATTMIGARVPLRDAETFRRQADRYGLTTSRMLGLLIKGAVAGELAAVVREHGEESEPRGAS